MTGVAAVGIHDDLAAGKAGVAHRAADDELAGRIDEEAGLLVHQLSRDGGLDHALNQLAAESLMVDFRRMLGGHNDGIHAHGLIIFVLHGHLALAVRAQPGQLAAAASLGQAAGDAVRQRNGHRHHFRGLVAGVAEHHALVAGADIVFTDGAAFQRSVNALRDIRALAMQRGQHSAGAAVKAELGAVVADITDDLAHDVVHTVGGGGGHLAHHHHNAGGGAGFARHAGIRILLEDRVEHRVRNLVANFIRMSFGNGFGSKQLSHF